MTILNNDELRERILKAGHITKAKITISQKMYSNNTVSPFETKNQDVVEIGIDDLMDLFEQVAEEDRSKIVEMLRYRKKSCTPNSGAGRELKSILDQLNAKSDKEQSL